MNEEVREICSNLKLGFNTFGQLDVLQLVRKPFSGVWTTVGLSGEEGPQRRALGLLVPFES